MCYLHEVFLYSIYILFSVGVSGLRPRSQHDPIITYCKSGSLFNRYEFHAGIKVTFSLTVDKLDPHGRISVRHTFYGDTEAECEQLRDQHAEGCQAFGPALKADKVIQVLEEIDDDDRPEWVPD
jgi:hypothetical protein